MHVIPTARHPGCERTINAARRVYHWLTVRVDIDRYMVQCTSCAKHKRHNKGPSNHAATPITRMSMGNCFNTFITVTKESLRLTLPFGVHGSFLKICGSNTRQKQNSCIHCARTLYFSPLSIHNTKNINER